MKQSQVLSLKGILPTLGQVTWVRPDAQLAGWGLPGHGPITKPLECGTYWTKGCVNVAEHPQALDGRKTGQAFVKVKARHCGKPRCPRCYESWAAREAQRIEHRIESFKLKGGRGEPIHLVLSPPEKDWGLPPAKLKQRAFNVARAVGFLGGACVFHPFRQDDVSKQWRFGPHLHLLGYGWIVRSKEVFQRSGWVAKNLGVRDSVLETARYQLSHAGIWYGSGRKHSVTWFGKMSYNKMKVKPAERQKDVCPLCQQALEELVWIGPGECPVPLDKEGEYFVDPKGWVARKRACFSDSLV